MKATNNRTVALYAMKGGSGTTVTAALIALRTPDETLVVDLGGDMADVLGVRPPSWTLDDFLLDPSVGELDDLVIDIDPTTRLLPAARRIEPGAGNPDQRRRLDEWLDRQQGTIVVDAGTGVPPTEFVERAGRTFAVTRPCYLALIRAARTGFAPDGVIAIREDRRALGPSDIERSFNAPIVATIDHDPDIARTIDAGLLIEHAHRIGGMIDRFVGRPLETALDRWRAAKPSRHSPDVDYGMRWQRAGEPERRWRVSWNTGSGDMYAIGDHEGPIIDLAHYETQEAADAAIEDWAYLHRRADGLDRLRTHLDRNETNNRFGLL